MRWLIGNCRPPVFGEYQKTGGFACDRISVKRIPQKFQMDEMISINGLKAVDNALQTAYCEIR